MKETLVASEGLKAWRYPIRNNSYPVARETDLKGNSMFLHRREWLLGAAGGLALSLTGATAMAQRAASQGVRAIAFDAFPVFDPRPVFALAEELFPGKGQRAERDLAHPPV